MKNVSQKFDVPRSTVSDIFRSRDTIQKVAGINKNNLSIKKINLSRYLVLESKVLEWYEKSRQNGLFITGPMIMAKAMEIHKESGSKHNFRASTGWLDRFKRRNGIKLVRLMDVKRIDKAVDQNGIDSCTAHSQSIIEYYNLTPEQIYNAGETDLFWKLMPKPSTDKDEFEASPRPNHDRITLLGCTNATGNHKLPLICVGRKSRGITSNDISDLPLIYYSQKTASMDIIVFYDWFHNIFVPSVRDHLKSRKLPEKALLIIDHNPSHPNAEFLKTADNSFSVLYLTPDIKGSIQPMQLGIIHDLKSFYRYSLLSDVINKNFLFAVYEKQLDFVNALKMLGTAWGAVSIPRIQQAFNEILSINATEDIKPCEINIQSFSELLKVIPECLFYNYTIERLSNWLFCDDADFPRISQNYQEDGPIPTEIDCENNQKTIVYKKVSENSNSVIFEEIGSSDDNLVENKSDEYIDDILTTTQIDFIKNELDMIDENDFFELENVSPNDAYKAIKTVLTFVKNDPKMESKDVEYLLELKEKICNRLSDL